MPQSLRSLVFGLKFRGQLPVRPTTPRYGGVVNPPDTPRPAPRGVAKMELSRRRERPPQGFFKQSPLSLDERRERTARARGWLYWILSKGPMEAREIIWRAGREGISERSLRRAKKHFDIRAYKTGGKRHGWGAVWYWRLLPD